MPEMDGLEAAAAIRAREAGTGSHVPIVAMTAHAMKGDRQRCLEAGMDEYVSKPIRGSQLMATIQSVVHCRSVSEDCRAEACGEGDSDWSEALAATGGDEELMKAVMEVFLEEEPRLVGRHPPGPGRPRSFGAAPLGPHAQGLAPLPG